MNHLLAVQVAILLICLLAMPIQTLAGSGLNKNDISRIEGLLKRAESNLQSVQTSLSGRTSPPKGSAGKLASRRLKQVYGDLELSKKLFENLPAGSQGAAAAVERYNNAIASYQKLVAFMKGEEAAESEVNEGEVALGYPQADQFKNAQFTLKGKVLAPARKLVQLHEKLKSEQDQLSIDYQTTAGALNSIKEARRQAEFVRAALAKIPANGQGVAAAKASLTQALASLETSEQYFTSLNKQLTAGISPDRYPKFDVDRKRLSSLAVDYALPSIFTENRARAAELFYQRDAAQKELERIVQKYRRLVQQDTDMGRTIAGVSKHASGSFEKFDAMILQQKQALPQSIRADLAEAKRMGDEAIANQTPLWFTGGIPQRIGRAQDKIELLQVIDKNASQAMSDEFVGIKARLKKQSSTLKALIIRENRLPEDNYAGTDRETVIKIARSGWSGQQKDARVLKIVIPAKAWSRETKWFCSNGTWYFSDRSKLQVRLIVADHENIQQAIDRPVTVIKDHQRGDIMIGVPMRDFDEALEPGEYFLIENVNES